MDVDLYLMHTFAVPAPKGVRERGLGTQLKDVYGNTKLFKVRKLLLINGKLKRGLPSALLWYQLFSYTNNNLYSKGVQVYN